MKNQAKLSVGFLFDDTLDSADGVAQYVKTLGAWLSGQGHTVCYLVGETKINQWAGGPVYSLSKNQTVYFNGNKLSVPRSASRRRINEVLSRHRLDVLHVMVPYSPLLAKKVIATADPRTAIIGTFHIFPAGRLTRLGSRGLAKWLGRSLNRFDRIISVSPAAAGFAKTAYGLDTQVVPNPVDIKRFSGAKSKPEPQLIVFLGRLVRRKGVSQLMEAFSVLKKTMPKAKLIIAGDGPDRQKLEAKSRRLGLSDSVDFLGFIDEADKPDLLARAAVACFPSLYGEAFGIVLIEAMAAGAGTVLAGDNPGYRSVLGARPALLADPDRTTEFAGRLQQLLQDAPMAEELHAWQAHSVKKYDINLVGQRILKLYNGQIARRAKKSNNKAHE